MGIAVKLSVAAATIVAMILHADADAFFASVAARRDPALIDRPVAVASHIICSANYPARGFGIHAAMRTRDALRRCPELTLVGLGGIDTVQAGRELMTLFEQVAHTGGADGRVEPGSMEEAFLDVRPRDPVEVAAEIRARARDELGLPVSVGIARTRLLAKLASRRAKPDGLLVIRSEEEPALRAALSIEDLWGIGPRTSHRLRDALGVRWLRELAGHTEATLAPVVGTAMARRLVAIHAGTEDDSVKLLGPRRTIAATKTLRGSTRQRAVVGSYLDQVIDTAVRRLREARGLTHHVETQVKLEDGSVHTEGVDLETGTDDRSTIAECAHLMLDLTGYAADGRRVVLVGICLRLTGVAGSRAQEVLPFDQD